MKMFFNKILKLIIPKKNIRLIWLKLFYIINNKDFLFTNGKLSEINFNLDNSPLTVIYVYILTALDICIHKNFLEQHNGGFFEFVIIYKINDLDTKNRKVYIPYPRLSFKTNKKVVDKLKPTLLELNDKGFIITNIKIKL